ncbi:MAG: NAD(P)/FAD-dependent oxidoreductase [Cypionkella sp.]
MTSIFTHGHRDAPRVCIIGGGIVGAAAAFFLSRQGCLATVLERDTLGSRASGVNFGGVRRHGRDPVELPLAIRSRSIWGRLPELIGHDCDFETHGHLKIARTEVELATLETWASVGRAHGIAVKMLDGATLIRDYPWLTRDIAGASFCVGDGFANPRLVTPTFARAAQLAGATFREGFTVTEVVEAADGGFVVTGNGGDSLKADILVNAAGAWASPLAAEFGISVPMVTRAPQMFVTEPTARMIAPVLGMVSGGIYLRQSVRGNVIFGGGQGSIAPDGLRSRPDETTLEDTTRLMRQLIPSLAHVPLIRSWTGIEGNTPDGLPVIGQSGRNKGFFCAFGFSGHGFAMGPGVGEALADQILTGRSAIDLAPFSPHRFDSPAAASVINC